MKTENSMRLCKLILLFIVAIGFCSHNLYADEHDGESRFDQDLDENDFQAVRNFVQAKRAVSLKDKISNIEISGEVHAEWTYLTEKIRGRNVRGDKGVYIFRELEDVNDEIYEPGEVLPLSHNDFDVEFDLKIKYTQEDAWAATHLRFDESAGVDDNGIDCSLDPQGYHGSGSCDNICLKQAYIGYNIYKCDDSRFYVEVGRRGNLSKVFYSEIEFLSRLDGIFLRYQGQWKNKTDWYVQGAAFIVDERVNHFAWVTEAGLVNICDSGFDITYSFIDWRKNGRNRCFAQNPIGFKFLNSQITLSYNFKSEILWNQEIWLTGGFLYNHNPARYTFINGRKKHIGNQNKGWWVGVNIGDLEDGDIGREGDWSVNAIYAVVEAQCVPDNDVNIIGIGNALHQSFTGDGRGNTNWKGWQINGVYALTNNITLLALFDYSSAYDKKISGSHTFSKFKMEAIYAF
jgi:hypothetical protein